MLDAAVFGAFAFLALSFDAINKHLSAVNKKRLHRLAGVAAILSHPATMHTLHEYAIHFVVYSGRIIPMH